MDESLEPQPNIEVSLFVKQSNASRNITFFFVKQIVKSEPERSER